ncbi:PhzF family phenazine biosynthesis protein [Lunatibacter salilacus]|uniref:PhzF family phenazine biosynthesis protein n=1 Tax=Lunatibacter salilacus TaxID=2483804 RepID=UPI00131AD807|nr:PhzF family phenazine biosynthesis isomerase [Lunatibacter salilacus]
MKKSRYDYRIAAVFTNSTLGFKGNPAAVIETSEELSTLEMQQLAAEIGQPATSFLSPTSIPDTFLIRWFAPDEEIGLCGHGAAAAAAFLGQKHPQIVTFTLQYAAGKMQVKYEAPNSVSLIMDPIPVIKEVPIPKAISAGLGISLLAMYETGNKHIILAESESAIRQMVPNFEMLRQSEIFGYAVTAPGDQIDFVSRTLVPHVQQLEDHATGSSHAMLAHFWSGRLNKQKMNAHQLSPRGGAFKIILEGEKLALSGEFEWLN